MRYEVYCTGFSVVASHHCTSWLSVQFWLIRRRADPCIHSVVVEASEHRMTKSPPALGIGGALAENRQKTLELSTELMAQEGDMNRWLIVHDLESFRENPRLIGFVGKKNLDGSPTLDSHGSPLPADKKVLKIRSGDIAVYYCRGDSVVKGLYEIVRPEYGMETRWPESPFQFTIKPIIELDEPYDFKPLIGSLDLFKDLPDRRGWGLRLHGIYNAVKPLTEEDYNTIKVALTAAVEHEEKEEEDKSGLAGYRKHLLVQHQIAEWGIKNGYRVHVATNDRGKIKRRLTEVLDDIPKFHTDDVLGIARRIDVLFFDGRRNILTHAFEVEHTPIIYSGLLRLNDVAESYPVGKVQFIIVSDESNNNRFDSELVRPSFHLLRENKCRFVSYKQVAEEWKQLQNRRPPPF